MRRSRAGGHVVPRAAGGRERRRRPASRLLAAIGVAAAFGVTLPAPTAGAVRSGPTPSLKQLLAEAAKLSYQIDDLSQQYDALRIQYTQARAQLKIARMTVAADERILSRDQAAIGRIAAAGYMTGAISPAMQLLESSNPQVLLHRAAILTELQLENGHKLGLVAAARAAAARARLLAVQEEHQAARLAAGMRRKVAQIQAREDRLNSAAFAQALAIYRRTGRYPNIHVTGDSVGVQALRWALTRIGDPYVWGAAGPNAFDCSGLVVWAYAQIGISLPHYTGDLWNSGMHVSRSQLEPGDLVFFFPDIGHVGIYVGNGLMVDAPTYGIPVGIHPIMWSVYVGAVRIV